jgi:hypothetical protein
MVIQLKIIKSFILIIRYIKSHALISIVALYFILGIVLKTLFSIDVLIPCLWDTLFHVNCPGCGLTSAFINILTLDISEAYNANAMIFIILPVGIIYLYLDIMKYKNNIS